MGRVYIEPRLADYEEVLDSLDAYGHLAWTAGYGSEEEDYDWMACFDFRVFQKWTPDGPWMIAWHVVLNSESGGYVDTADEDVVDLQQAPYDLVRSYTMDAAFEYMSEEDLGEMEETNISWNEALRENIVPAALRTWYPQEMGAYDAAIESQDPDALEDAWVGLEALIEHYRESSPAAFGVIGALQRAQQSLFPEGGVRRRT